MGFLTDMQKSARIGLSAYLLTGPFRTGLGLGTAGVPGSAPPPGPGVVDPGTGDGVAVVTAGTLTVRGVSVDPKDVAILVVVTFNDFSSIDYFIGKKRRFRNKKL